jgi:predicted TPR repeat methyltransferase
MAAAFDAALNLHKQGRLDEAAAAYRKLLARQPAHFDALHMLGVIAGQQARWDEAIELLGRARKLRPDNPSVLTNLGNAFGSIGRHQEAVAAYEQSLALRPADAKALRNRGTSLRALERPEAALASFDAALALKPDYPEALVGRAECLLVLQRRNQAIESFQQALRLGKDVEQLHFVLASLGAEATPTAAPPKYVEALFDGYAEQFDKHLVGKLAYRTPQVLDAALASLQAPGFGSAVDLGCGTGLCGPLLRPRVQRLVGVDLSSLMLAKAEATGCYDELVHAELVGHLQAHPGAYELAVAADVFNYLGDLGPAFDALHAALRPGAWLAFSLEAGAEGDFQLQSTRRFVHSEAYLRALIERSGFTPLHLGRGTLREESSAAVEGLVVVLQRAV